MPQRIASVAKSAALLGVFVIAAAGCSSTANEDAPWTLVQSSAASSSVVVLYYHGSCNSLLSGTVISDATSVHIKLRVKSAANGCDSALRTTLVRVRLGLALGSRTVEGGCHPARRSLCQPPSTVPVPTGRLRVVGP